MNFVGQFNCRNSPEKAKFFFYKIFIVTSFTRILWRVTREANNAFTTSSRELVTARGTIIENILFISISSVRMCRFVFSYTVLSLSVTYLIFNLFEQGLHSAHSCIFSLCFELPTSWVIVHIFYCFLKPPRPFKNNQFPYNISTIIHF